MMTVTEVSGQQQIFRTLDPVNTLPLNIFLNIFSLIENLDLYHCYRVSRRWKKIVVLKFVTFGEYDWNRYFGSIGNKIPELPYSILNILASALSLKERRTVAKTHILVLVPETVNGEPLTLESLGKLVQTPKNEGCPSRYRWFSDYITSACKTESVVAHWVLMTKSVIKIEEDEELSYEDQKGLISLFAYQTGIPYHEPSLRDAAVCIFMYHAASGNRLFNDSPWIYTRCREKDKDGDPVAVGGFSSTGLCVTGRTIGKEYGMAATVTWYQNSKNPVNLKLL